MINISIVEDEENILSSIKQILNEYCSEVNIIGTASDIKSATDLLNNDDTDLALLDINITGGIIFDVLKKLDNVRFKIIFITAHEEYAIQAIKFSAFDYLLKPIDPLELIKSINNASKTINKENTDIQLSTLVNNLDAGEKGTQKIILKTSESIHLAGIEDIIRCESDSSYTTFYLISGKKVMVSKTLKEYDELLSDKGFFRVHQSHLINLNYIDHFEKGEGGYLVMKDKSQVPVSFRKKDALLKTFDKLGR
jgi:two-component system LytT family response regulator